MTVEELRKFVQVLRNHGFEVKRRWQLDDAIKALADALWCIDKCELALQIRQLYNDLEAIETEELVKTDIF